MTKKSQIQYPKIGVLSLAHMLNDMYSNYLPQMLPFLIAVNPGFTATRAAILVSSFTVTSSLSSPCSAFFSIGRANAGWSCRNFVDGDHAQHDRTGP